MPRFHFNVYDGITALDQDGTQLRDTNHARCEALRLAGELLKMQGSKPSLGHEWRLEVTDGRGMILFRIDIMLTESAAMGER